MAEARFTFPKKFLWGTATSAYQVEGGNTNNNWHAWEQAGRIEPGHKAGLACDWWGGRWREDFDRAAESGQTAHRLSVEWSRIQPEPGRWDESAIDHYREMVRGLRERGMMPMVTLHHFTDPLWLHEQGGFEEDRVSEFEAFTERVVTALKEYVDLWVTFNEPNVYVASGYVLGVFPPGKQNIVIAGRVMQHIVRAHAAAYDVIHRIQPRAQVGLAHQVRGMAPARPWFPPDRWVAGYQSKAFNRAIPHALKTGWLSLPAGIVRIPQARGTQDFFGLNYYTRERLRFAPLAPRDIFSVRQYRQDALLSPTGFIANEPEGFFEALKWAQSYELPIHVTENGVEDPDDRLRPRYLVEHLRSLWRAANFNWKVKSYFHWSLVDNFEWERGWTQRFGLWALDEATQVRRRRSSADLYAEVCRANALSSEIVARYAPAAFGEMFPNQ